ncbi:hypothetical protein [Klebsiella phage 05F01]|nr:hypothetical protein [Klebsiella phage 05F01]
MTEAITDTFQSREEMIRKLNFLLMTGGTNDARIIRGNGIYQLTFTKNINTFDGEFDELSSSQTLETT